MDSKKESVSGNVQKMVSGEADFPFNVYQQFDTLFLIRFLYANV